MKCTKQTMLLYAVTDRAWTGEQTLAEQVEQALQNGVTCLQLREKNMSDEDFLQEALEIKALCQRYQIPFIINDNVKVAIACAADGIHVGQDDCPLRELRQQVGPDMMIGLSVHTVAEALQAEADGADYLGLGAVFSTSTKLDVDVMPRETLQAICAATSLPTVAIGGISKETLPRLAGSGVNGAAVVSAIFAAENIPSATQELRQLAYQYLQKSSMKTVLSIAGSDCSGGAGIQADIKTITMNGAYAMTAITALTVQNTMGVSGVMEVSPEFLAAQIDAVFEDIRPDAVKIGMVSSPALVQAIAERLSYHQAQNVVVDPVMVATSGSSLSSNAAVEAMKAHLFPLATLITPNIPEAEVLSGMRIENAEDMEKVALFIEKTYHCSVLCKGGHFINDANDLLCHEGKMHWFKGRRIDNPNTHGTGCTLSSAIATHLAKGQSLEQAIENAKHYLSDALEAMLDLGQGSGPLNHLFSITQ